MAEGRIVTLHQHSCGCLEKLGRVYPCRECGKADKNWTTVDVAVVPLSRGAAFNQTHQGQA